MGIRLHRHRTLNGTFVLRNGEEYLDG
jgi:hypothetical protein